MSNPNNNDPGNRIQDSVDEALRTGEFENLNSQIRATVLSALNEVGDQINSAFSSAKGSTNASASNTRNVNSQQENSRGFTNAPIYTTDKDVQKHHSERDALIRRPQKSDISRVKYKEVGAVSGYFGVFGGSWMLLVGLAGLSSGSILGIAVFGLGVAAIVKGSNNLKWNSIAKRYKRLVSEKMYVGIDTIASATGTSEKKVIKNVKKILAKGFFPEGYIDDTNTTFMATREIYDYYLATKLNAVERLTDQRAAQQQEQEQNAQNRLNAMISSGMNSVERIRILNERIPGEIISQKLYKLENLLNEIFDTVREHPNQIDNCRKLMDYYLPMIIKLVEAYADYDKISHPGQDIIAAKKDIEHTLDITNQSFAQLLNKLYQDSVWDVKSDAKVLKTMLRQEGLAQDGLGGTDHVTNFGVEYVTDSANKDDIVTVTEDQLRPLE